MNKQFRKISMVVLITLLVGVVQSCTGQQGGSVLPTQPPLSEELQGKVDRIDESITLKTKDGTFSGAALIMQDGIILLNKGYGFANRKDEIPNTPQTRFQLNRGTMPFTALAIMLLYQDGKLDLRDPICNYLERCPSDWREFTIADLLKVTTTIPDYTLMPTFRDTKLKPIELDDLVKSIEALPLDSIFAPDLWFGDSGFILLGMIIERVSETTYEKFLKERIFKPTGMKNTGLIHGTGEDDNLAIQYKGSGSEDIYESIDMSNLYSTGGLYSTVEDVYLFLKALESGKLLPQDQVDFMLMQGQEIPEWWSENYNQWVSGWFFFDYNGLAVRSSTMSYGWEGSYFTWLPEEDIYLIFLINQEVTPFLWGGPVVVDILVLGK